jgi:peptidoglycan-associated lipoprotein
MASSVEGVDGDALGCAGTPRVQHEWDAMEGTTLFKRALSFGRLPVLVLAVALLGACAKKETRPAGNQANAGPNQSATPNVVEQPDSSGPILSEDANANSGREVPGDEGPLKRVHFEYDSSDLNAEAQTILGGNTGYLREHASTFIRIEGHCDERGSVEYNQALGERRANSAKVALVAQGIDAKRLDTISYGEDRPLSFEHNDYGWALNRRAEFRILSE